MSNEPGAGDMDPEEIDWTEEDILDEPAALSPGGTCYAGATAGTLTAHIQIHLGVNIYASSQQMIDCCLNPGGTKGGCCIRTLECIKTHGVRFRIHYPVMPDPDVEARGSCLDCEGTLADMPRITIVDCKVIYSPKRVQMLQALREGPVVLDIFVGPAFHLYQTEDEDDILDYGVYAENDKVDGLMPHSVVLMGGKNGEFQIKNGWSPEWGFNGYAKLSQELTYLFLRIAFPIGVAIDWNGWDRLDNEE